RRRPRRRARADSAAVGRSVRGGGCVGRHGGREGQRPRRRGRYRRGARGGASRPARASLGRRRRPAGDGGRLRPGERALTAEDLCFASSDELARLYRAGDVSPVDVVDALLARIESVEPVLNAYATVLPDALRAAAVAAEQRL